MCSCHGPQFTAAATRAGRNAAVEAWARGPAPTSVPTDRLRAEIAYALADFDACRYGNLAHRLPWLIRAAHVLTADGDIPQHHTLLAEVYLLTTRILIKLHNQQLGWMAADRARVTADISG
ncbi:MAG: hypothetical protein ACRDUV_19225, partial [Pseudonocardiaceae bacterium]